MKISAQNTFGFTLVELLMVVSIIAVMGGFLIPGFSNYIDNQNLLQAQELLKSDLRTAQNRALTGVGSSVGTTHWGVKIPTAQASSYLFFSSAGVSGAACDAVTESTAGVTKSETLPGGATVAGSGGACVFFSTRNGDAVVVNNGDSDMLRIARAGQNPCHAVQINSAGMVRGVDICE